MQYKKQQQVIAAVAKANSTEASIHHPSEKGALDIGSRQWGMLCGSSTTCVVSLTMVSRLHHWQAFGMSQKIKCELCQWIWMK